jgi:hypothetical protein
VTRLGLLAAALGLIPLTMAGCTREGGTDIEERLDKIAERVDKLQGSAGPAAGKRQRPKQARPDPATTYAVPIVGSHSEGPKHAKVTLVDGFEFA